MDLADFIEQFGLAVEAGQASLLIGAGLSTGAGYPSWQDLLEPIANQFEVPAMSDLPLRAEYIENQSGGRERLSQHLATAIGAVDPAALENHFLLAQLGIRDSWTTNYDPLIETADPDLNVIQQDKDLVDRPALKRRLNKMHGSIPHGAIEPVGGRGQLVLSRSDYERYAETHPRLWRLLQAQFLTSSFLFLGFSMTDQNFEAVFGIARLATRDKLMPHYALMKRPDDDSEFDFMAEDLRKAGIEVIEISSYADITTVLQRLVARTRPAGVFVSGSARSPSDIDSAGAETYLTSPSSEDLERFAAELGSILAGEAVPLIVAGGDIGARVGYSFIAELEPYDAGRFVLLRRRSSDEVTPPSRRQGQIHFVGDIPDLLRAEALERVRAVVVLGGGPGTEEEAHRALEMRMTVVPIAHTGGAARKIWGSMSQNLADHHCGQQPVDPQLFAELGSDNKDVAMQAAVRLIRTGLFLPSNDQIDAHPVTP